MHSSLRILQITLIITQLTSVKATTVASAASSVKAGQSTPVWPESNVTAWPSETAKTIIYGGSMQTVSNTTNNSNTTVASAASSVKAEKHTLASPGSSVTAWPLETLETGIVDSSSAMKTGSPMTKVPVTSSTKASDISNSSNVTTGVPSATPPKLSTPTLLKGSFSENATETGLQTTIVRYTSSIVATTTTTSNTVFVASTRSTTLSPSGLLTSQTQSITANYSLSSASGRGSNSPEPKQTLTTSLPVSVNWTDWSVDSCQCQEFCSGKGGTVTASRQCYSHTKTLEVNVCTKHDNVKKVVKCGDEHCPVSGKEAFGSSISTLAVSILLVMLSSTFVRD